jgi:hypothetical protein
MADRRRVLYPRIPAPTIAIFGLLLGLWCVVGVWLHPEARACDALNIYAGASMTWSGQSARLYDVQAQLDEERKFYPTPVHRPYVRLPFHALLFGPFILLPYNAATWAMYGVMMCLAIAAAWWLARLLEPDAVALVGLFIPLWVGMALGQDCSLYFLLSVAGFAAHRKGADFRAGLLFACVLAKFHLILLLPLLLVLQRRWRLLAGFTTGASILAAISLGLCGVSGLRQYFSLITSDNPLVQNTPGNMVNVGSILLNTTGASPPLYALCSACLLACAIRTMLRHRDWRGFAACFAGSAVIAPHVYSYDLSVFLPFLCMAVLRATRLPLRVVATALVVPVPYLAVGGGRPWAAAAALLLAAFVVLLAFEPAGECERPESVSGVRRARQPVAPAERDLLGTTTG